MNNINFIPFKTLAKIIISIVAICSIFGNINQCSEIHTLKVQLSNKDSIVSKKDTLLGQILNNDSLLVSKFGVENSIEISAPLLQKKIDSLTSEGNFGSDVLRPSKGGFYSKTKFTATLKDAKSLVNNDSIAEYSNSNWYINYNKVSSIFNARYQGEQETLTTFVPKYSLGKWDLTKPDLNTYKWSDDKGLVVTESETINVPAPEKKRKFEAYLNSEFRQGVEIADKRLNTLNNTSSAQLGAGLGYKFNRHNIGVEANHKVYGNELLPKNEIKFKYQFYLTK